MNNNSDDEIDGICSNKDYDFFYHGLSAGKLLIQRCRGCQRLRNPPSPMCPHCNALAWEAMEMSGLGTVYSYTIHRYPPLPGFELPHLIGLIALEEGVRFVAALDGVALDEIEIGLPVEAEFLSREGVPSIQFRAQKRHRSIVEN
jgi:uncharacterized protein